MTLHTRRIAPTRTQPLDLQPRLRTPVLHAPRPLRHALPIPRRLPVTQHPSARPVRLFWRPVATDKVRVAHALHLHQERRHHIGVVVLIHLVSRPHQRYPSRRPPDERAVLVHPDHLWMERTNERTKAASERSNEATRRRGDEASAGFLRGGSISGPARYVPGRACSVTRSFIYLWL